MGLGKDELSDRGDPIHPMLPHMGVSRQGSVPDLNLPSDLKKWFPSSEVPCKCKGGTEEGSARSWSAPPSLCLLPSLACSLPSVGASIITACNCVWYRVYSTLHVMSSQSSRRYVMLTEDRMALVVAIKKVT